MRYALFQILIGRVILIQQRQPLPPSGRVARQVLVEQRDFEQVLVVPRRADELHPGGSSVRKRAARQNNRWAPQRQPLPPSGRVARQVLVEQRDFEQVLVVPRRADELHPGGSSVRKRAARQNNRWAPRLRHTHSEAAPQLGDTCLARQTLY